MCRRPFCHRLYIFRVYSLTIFMSVPSRMTIVMMETYSLLRILLVEDSREEADFISEMLQNAAGISFEVIAISQVKAMFRMLEVQQFHALMISYEYLRTGAEL